METILDNINQAYKFISTILVSGDAAEAVAASRVKLRNAMAACEVKIREEEKSKVLMRNAEKKETLECEGTPVE